MDNMDMEISDSDESIIRSKKRKVARLRIVSSSSDENFVNFINEETSVPRRKNI